MGSLEAPERKTRMELVLDRINPTRLELFSVTISCFSVCDEEEQNGTSS